MCYLRKTSHIPVFKVCSAKRFAFTNLVLLPVLDNEVGVFQDKLQKPGEILASIGS